MRNLFDLANRVAIVAGSSRGIGQAAANVLYAFGAKVYGYGRSATPEMPGIFECYRKVDIQDSYEIKKYYEKIYKDERRIDILVNAAGVSYPEGLQANSIERFVNTVDINLLGIVRSCEIALPYMILEKKGSIINITSIAAKLGFPKNPGYVASKGALAAYTRALAVDNGVSGIRVNNIAPGYIITNMTMQSYQDVAANSQRKERTLLNRWGEPGDISGAVIFLASDASSYVTGSDIYVDGGWSVKGL